MNFLIMGIQLLPLLTMLLITGSRHNEDRIAQISSWGVHLTGLCIVVLLALWAMAGFQEYEFEWFNLYASDDYRFPVLFYLDRIGAVYLFCVWVIFAVIIKYCRVYMHREAGYQRFFLNIFAFLFGLNLIVLSGSIDMLFAGWEIVGMSSFLLIAFYRHRPQPIRNAFRAYCIYRYCDIGLLLGTWMSHLLFHESQHFSEIARLFANDPVEPANYSALVLLSMLILIAASGKSAQFPFCFWLPRAMEGPTPSSAIFYGALSVHLGVFLLLRTEPIWGYHMLTRLIVFMLGFLTVIVAALAEKTQSNIKGQIAYASLVQVGLMFIELAMGLNLLVLIHFLGNAFLRCYQLLVSPSIVTYLLRMESAADHGFKIDRPERFSFLPESIRHTLPEVLYNSLYVLSLQEGLLEQLIRSLFWQPLHRAGRLLNKIAVWRKSLALMILFPGAGFVGSAMNMGTLGLAISCSILMILTALSALDFYRKPRQLWERVGLGALAAGAGVWFLNPAATIDIMIFSSGIIPAWLLGYWVLHRANVTDLSNLNHRDYYALDETQPRYAGLLLLSFLGVAGFPVTPAFLGEDLLLSHASAHHPWFAVPITISFVINGIAMARMYQRICMGRPTELNQMSVL